MKQRERKFEKYNRPSVGKRKQEMIGEKLRREVNIDEFSRPKKQKKKDLDELISK